MRTSWSWAEGTRLRALAAAVAWTTWAGATSAAEPSAYDMATSGQAERTPAQAEPTPSKEAAVADASRDWALDGSIAIVGGSGTLAPPVSSIDDVALPRSVMPKNSGGGVELRLGFHSKGVVGFDVPFVGFRTLIIGDIRTNIRAADGTLAALDVGLGVSEVSLFGLGGHLQLGPVLVRASMAPVVEWTAGSGTVTQGFISNRISADASFAAGIDAHLDACGLVDDHLGICAVAAPRMWRTIDGESGPGNGVYFGLGAELW